LTTANTARSRVTCARCAKLAFAGNGDSTATNIASLAANAPRTAPVKACAPATSVLKYASRVPVNACVNAECTPAARANTTEYCWA
jgi:hypothetical protein